MFDLRMAWRSLGRSRGLTAVMVAALAVGIGTWYAQHQIFAFLDGKMPSANADVFHVSLERGEPAQARRPSDIVPRIPAILLAPRDARVILDGPHDATVTFAAPGLLEPPGAPAQTVRVRYATRALFDLFSIPLVEGTPWSVAADVGGLDATPTDEVVIDELLASRLFPGGPAVGKHVRVDGAELRVVGVVAAAHHARFHLYERFVDTPDRVYLPLAHASATQAAADVVHAMAEGDAGYVHAWVRLPTPRDREAFVARLERYLADEHARGRASAPRAVTLDSAQAWREVFAPGGTINLWPILSGMCLVTCVVNLVRMLMVKFAGRRHDLGLLRAFGARRREVMAQLLGEAMLVGLIAGVCGLVLGLAMMPLAASTVAKTPGTASLISLGDAAVTLAAAVLASLLAAIYPAWRLARGTPASQLGGP